MAEEHGLAVDAAGFEAAMEEARQKSRAGGRKAGVSAAIRLLAGCLCVGVLAAEEAAEACQISRTAGHKAGASACLAYSFWALMDLGRSFCKLLGGAAMPGLIH